MASKEQRQRGLVEIRSGVLVVLEKAVFEARLEPAKASPTLIWNYYQVQVEIETGRIVRLTPEDKLLALDKLERWYTERGVSFPNKEWLNQARERYKR